MRFLSFVFSEMALPCQPQVSLTESRLQAIMASPLLEQFFCVLVDEVGSKRPAYGTV